MKLLLPIGLILLACAACGPSQAPMYHLQGEISYNGVPLQNGELLLQDADGVGASFHSVVTDGRYDLKTSPGEKLVQIKGYRKTGRIVEPNPGEPVEEIESFLSKKFNDKSAMKITVNADRDDLDFHLAK
ncbi:hypothetical protein [Blastopirellula marina]|uniref:Lipoprotein n=1 Tax=Blastopirellula marina DSM 3645 TaxID=314230 RepID=A3ZLW5_9BACT|nr:hypothetical protein [Blastopirellula marina]EAQ82748.1 hypothetical protein DSM3645_10122 [Blastopirellula marina DSM 3645]